MDGLRERICFSISTICQGILKSDNLLHKQSFVKAQSLRTVHAAAEVTGGSSGNRVYPLTGNMHRAAKNAATLRRTQWRHDV